MTWFQRYHPSKSGWKRSSDMTASRGNASDGHRPTALRHEAILTALFTLLSLVRLAAIELTGDPPLTVFIDTDPACGTEVSGNDFDDCRVIRHGLPSPTGFRILSSN